MTQRLEELLGDFGAQLDALPETAEPPSTTLQILGRHKLEQDWQRLLFYFLSPSESHGLEHALLEHILTALADRSDMAYEYSAFDLRNVEVATEVTTAEGRRPDAVIWSGEDWFLCWELKVTATEGSAQTADYVDTAAFDSIGLSKARVPSEGHHYIYLASAAAAPPAADAFVTISWTWLAEQLQTFLAESHGSYPARTTAQLDEFCSTIQRELQMTPYQENETEKANLYFEYYDEIVEAKAAFDRTWESFRSEWGTRLADRMAAATVVAVPEIDETNVAVELDGTDVETQRWTFRQGDKDWAGIVKDGWWRHESTLSNIHTSSDDRDDFRLSLYHRLTENKELAVADNTLELQLWHGTDNGRPFMESFKDAIKVRLDENPDAFPPSAVYTGKRGNPLTFRYDIPVRDHSDFREAYVAALAEALVDIALTHAEGITHIDEVYELLLEDHY